MGSHDSRQPGAAGFFDGNNHEGIQRRAMETDAFFRSTAKDAKEKNDGRFFFCLPSRPSRLNDLPSCAFVRLRG